MTQMDIAVLVGLGFLLFLLVTLGVTGFAKKEDMFLNKVLELHHKGEHNLSEEEVLELKEARLGYKEVTKRKDKVLILFLGVYMVVFITLYL